MAKNLRVGVQRGLRQSIGGGLGTGDIFTLSPASFDFERTKTVDSRITFARSSSATFVGADKLIQSAGSGVARFDHDPATGKSLGLLIEESRINKINNSKLDTGGNGFWQSFSPEGTTATWTADSIASPDGTVSAGLAQKNGGGNPRFINLVDLVGADTVLTASVFCKQYQTEEVLQLAFYNMAGVSYSQATININSAAATLGTGFSSAVVEDFDNSWKRVSVKYTVPSSATGTTATFSLQPSSTTSGMYLWGAQVEVGSFLTSLITTSGSTATRAADSAEIAGTNFSSFFNQNGGTVFIKANGAVLTGNPTSVEMHDGTANNRHTLDYGSGAITTVASGTSQSALATGAPSAADDVVKTAFAYAVNDFAASKDGGSVVSDTSGSIPTVSEMQIGNDSAGTKPLNGHIKRVAYFPTRLADKTLQSVTS